MQNTHILLKTSPYFPTDRNGKSHLDIPTASEHMVPHPQPQPFPLAHPQPQPEPGLVIALTPPPFTNINDSSINVSMERVTSSNEKNFFFITCEFRVNNGNVLAFRF